MVQTIEEHKKRHNELHKMLDELTADHIRYNIDGINDIEQTKNPTEGE